MRKIVAKDQMDLQAWSDTRVDQLVRYVSNLADERLFERFSENPGSLLSSEGKKAADRCPRLRRAYLLLKHGIVSERELETLMMTLPLLPETRCCCLLFIQTLALMQAQIDQYVGDYALKLSADTWLVEQEQVGHTEEVLRILAEQNSPPRHMLRGAKVQGPAEWFGKVLLGPLPIRAVDTVRTRPWGDIDGISDLPLPLPPPPSAIKAWAFALTMLIIGIVAWRFAINSEVRENPFALDAEFYVTSQAVDVRFDVDDQA